MGWDRSSLMKAVVRQTKKGKCLMAIFSTTPQTSCLLITSKTKTTILNMKGQCKQPTLKKTRTLRLNFMLVSLWEILSRTTVKLSSTTGTYSFQLSWWDSKVNSRFIWRTAKVFMSRSNFKILPLNLWRHKSRPYFISSGRKTPRVTWSAPCTSWCNNW